MKSLRTAVPVTGKQNVQSTFLVFLTINILLFSPLLWRGGGEAHAQGGQKWATGGNSNAAGDFLGTTNNQPVVFKTNNLERMRLTELGWVGIGTNNPGYLLDVNGRIHGKGNAFFDSLLTALQIKAAIIYTSSGSMAVDVNNRRMYNASGNVKMDWEQGLLYNGVPSNTISLKWLSRELTGIDGLTTTLNWGNRNLQSGQWSYDADYSSSYSNRSLVDKQYVDNKIATIPLPVTPGLGIVLTAGRNADIIGTLNSNSGTPAMNLNSRQLYNSAGNIKVDWEQGFLYNLAPSNVVSLKWIQRELVSFDGVTPALNWNSRDLVSGTGVSTLNWQNRKLGIGQWDYNADYSSSYTPRSLVDKEYVDTKVANIPPPQTSSLTNVLAVGRNADATGTILTNTSGYSININDRILHDGSGNATIEWNYKLLSVYRQPKLN